MKNGKLSSFFFSASAGGTGLASAVVSDIFVDPKLWSEEKGEGAVLERDRDELAQRENEIIGGKWRRDPELR